MSSLRGVERPDTLGELEHILRAAGAHKSTVAISGNSSKRLMAGPVEDAVVNLSLAGRGGIREYEPRDLTISVGAGMPWRDLTGALAENGQMIPLDPPFADRATVGGVVASNSSGPRRRLFGTARDLVIGMQFLTLEGKTVQSGGMVVKNVAGLDMSKLMIGSFGTLAAITVVNFKLTPAPPAERSFLFACAGLGAALAARDGVLRGVLQPSAIDLLSPAAGDLLGRRTWLLAIRAGGNRAAMDRYGRELARFGDLETLEGESHGAFWNQVQEFTPSYLAAYTGATVVRASCTLKEIESLLSSFPGPAVARAGNGVAWLHFEQPAAAAEWMAQTAGRGWKAVVEFAPEAAKSSLELWPGPVADLETMKRVKRMFDPDGLLNRGRLYGRI
jgi:glycolate oxidase FAD binding subunit